MNQRDDVASARRAWRVVSFISIGTMLTAVLVIARASSADPIEALLDGFVNADTPASVERIADKLMHANVSVDAAWEGP